MRRLFVISDLHLGGDKVPMLGHPELLRGFLERLASYRRTSGETTELVINGDFVDFLAEKEYAAWTSSETEAVQKLRNTLDRLPDLTSALVRCVRSVDRFTVLLGNHDVELIMPRVRDELLRRLEVDRHRSLLITDNEAYRWGDVVIEHGNRYDTWNQIDYDGLRRSVSALSRGEPPPKVQVCPGSRLVERVMNGLKERYHFIDLLKPEDKLVLLILKTLEPSLLTDVPRVLRAVQARLGEISRRLIPSRFQRRLISAASPAGDLPEEVVAAFGEELSAAVGVQRRLAGADPEPDFPSIDPRSAPADSLGELVRRGEPIEPTRLTKLQRVLRHKLEGDTTFESADGSGPLADGARDIVQRGVAKIVVMGHTHLRRDVQLEGGRYINTGTWCDLIEPDPETLVDSDEGRARLREWIGRLATDDLAPIRTCRPYFADIITTDDGRVVSDPDRPLLRAFSGEPLDGP